MRNFIVLANLAVFFPRFLVNFTQNVVYAYMRMRLNR
jgi:hypothetical protein